MSCALEGPALVAALLESQQQTAVSRFADWHENTSEAPRASLYRDLIPLSLPGEDEQYAFEVDLDACSGCKACVTACHNLNGLEDAEAWRSVGLLHGGTSQLPVLQHVTTACHHCLEPACLDGCPVHAYEKDPRTGIVRHLDDQCIGCQYCILKCPYDVPKFSHEKGIVRKCDMCQGRLAASEAPACVQACPNRAIRIRLVSRDLVREESEANLFLPGAPEPGYTLPTTVYRTRRPLARNLLPADYYSVSPQHAHWPLVLMLVLTQMSVGALAVDQALSWLAADSSAASTSATLVRSLAAFLLGVVGLAAAVLHLGRPLYAFRALLGLRTSWLSREILAFGVFALLATCYAAWPWLSGVQQASAWQRGIGVSAAVSGLAAVWCSVMIYASTRRPFWSTARTGCKFLGTAALLGLPTALLVGVAAEQAAGERAAADVMAQYGAKLCLAAAAVAVVKLALEAGIFAALLRPQFTPLKRTAVLMLQALGPTTLKRFVLGLAGGVLFPLVLAAPYFATPARPHSPLFVACGASLSLVLLLIGEIAERYMFFAAVVAPKMPGAVGP